MTEDREARARAAHNRRAADADTEALEERLREVETEQHHAREEIERELRHEHWGRKPEWLEEERGAD